jgi:hypothetical protein
MSADPRAQAIQELREQLATLRRWPILPSDTFEMAREKLLQIADLNLRIAELTLNR